MTSEHDRRGVHRPGWIATLQAVRPAASVLAVAMLSGCVASAPSSGEREYLDEQTAATVTVGSSELVFARERPELAVNARDYLTLVPVDVNRAGAHAQYFFGYAWSTIDRGATGSERPAMPRFDLVADGRRIPLVPHEGSLGALGLGELPVPPPSRSATVLVAPATREQLEFVRSASDVRALMLGDQGSERFDLWSR